MDKAGSILTFAPLPTWPLLFRALRGAGGSVTDAWSGRGDATAVLSQSAWSLALVALWRARLKPAVASAVWIPEFFCDSALRPLRQVAPALVFYPLRDNLTPDLAACRELASTQPPGVFVLGHFFGQPVDMHPVRQFCDRHGAWLVEDAAHIPKPVAGIGTESEFVLYSAHKHLPTPDGALLVARGERADAFGDRGLAELGSSDSWIGQLAGVTAALSTQCEAADVHAAAWLMKRLVQRLGLHRRPTEMPAFAEPVARDGTSRARLLSPRPSALGRLLLAASISDLPAIVRARQRNQLLLDELLLSQDPDLRPAARPQGRTWTPYLAAYTAGGEAATDQAYRRWAERRLPVLTWPDLPAEIDDHRSAWALRHSRLYVPVHQSLRLDRVARNWRRNRQPVPQVRLEWKVSTPGQWEQWIARVDRSNLLQTWAYGDAKAEYSGATAVRGVFLRGDEPIAITQGLLRGIGRAGVLRINRGPLPLVPLSRDDWSAVLDSLGRYGRWCRARVLSFAPELRMTGESLALLAEGRYRSTSAPAWESIWLDLRPGLAGIRGGFDRKWRNMLTAAEKAGATVETGDDDELYDWMVQKYRQDQRERGFSGVPVEILSSLRRRLPVGHVVVHRAIHDRQPVAGIVLVQHGRAATYVAGWNGPEGRALKANQLLLWKAIARLKSADIAWFDLGGISDELTPGITAFKQGMGGERYELAGEYWKC